MHGEGGSGSGAARRHERSEGRRPAARTYVWRTDVRRDCVRLVGAETN